MNDIDKLLAVYEIQTLKSRYYRFLDTKDWAGFETTFAPDAVIDFRGAVTPADENLLFPTAQAFIDNVRPMMTPMTTAHQGHMPEIEILSPTSASAVWALEDRVWVPDDIPAGFSWSRGLGHTYETYSRQEGGAWVIQSMRLTRLKTEQG